MPRQTKAQERRRKIKKYHGEEKRCAFVSGYFAVRYNYFRGEGEDKYVLVTVDGGVYGEFPLSEDTVVSVDESLGHNTIVISRGQVCISEADCPDRYCVKHSAVSKIGETIICLPHKLVVEIKSYGKGAADTGADAVAQ